MEIRLDLQKRVASKSSVKGLETTGVLRSDDRLFFYFFCFGQLLNNKALE